MTPPHRTLTAALGLLLAAASVPAARAQAPLATPDATMPTALYGMSWGDPLPQGMVKRDARLPAGTEMYGRASDKLELAGVPVNAIHYVFEYGRLGGFSIPVDAARKDALAAALTKSWGEPRVRAKDDYEWNAPTLRATFSAGPSGIFILNVFPR